MINTELQVRLGNTTSVWKTMSTVTAVVEGRFWWKDEITGILWELFEIEPEITYSYSSDGFDCFFVAWSEGEERFKIFVKVMT